MNVSECFCNVCFAALLSQSRGGETATGHKEKLEVVGVVGGSGVRGRDLSAAAAL